VKFEEVKIFSREEEASGTYPEGQGRCQDKWPIRMKSNQIK